ncbi:MAG: response regulator, partial [Myxococcales bacterium]|nr:response regulator [Myxococcales bacterium]
MEEAALERILLVDDEPLVLEGLARQLGWEFEVSTAPSGARALELVQSEGPFAVVISDMRMPNMDGAEFLERARALDPDMVRVLLTGQSDLLQAIRAVNHGQLFRFLSKPCPPDVLVPTIQDAVRQHRLLTAERELLEKTLRGSVQTLLDTLALAQPDTFGRARRVEQYVVEVLDTIGEKEQWSIQLAALLCHLPLITLPPETLRRYFDGKR